MTTKLSCLITSAVLAGTLFLAAPAVAHHKEGHAGPAPVETSSPDPTPTESPTPEPSPIPTVSRPPICVLQWLWREVGCF